MHFVEQYRADFVLEHANRYARRYWYKLPYEERHVTTIQDLAQDLFLHWLEKKHKYDETRRFDRWARTVLFNKAISITNKIWNAKYYKGIPPCGMTAIQSIGPDDDPTGWEVVLVDDLSPEIILLLQEIVMSAVTIDVSEVKGLAEQFGVSANEEDWNGTLVGVLTKTLNDMKTEDYEALPADTRTRLEDLGRAVSNNALTISKKPGGPKKGKGGGPGRRNPDGPVAKIRELFSGGEGITTVPEMSVKLTEMGVTFSEATVKTQVGRLRREHGMTNGRGGRGPSSTGIVATIRKNFAAGIQTVPEMVKALEADLEIGEFSPATVKTQVGKLRREAGLTSKAAAPAE